VSKPRLLYVPVSAGREADAVAALADWADVASFDAPGVGANRDLELRGVAGVVDAGRARLDELGWDACGIVCDSHAQAAGIGLALAEPERVTGIFIGHAASRYTVRGPRPALNPSVRDVAQRLLETDYRAFARAVTQMTRGLLDEAQVDAWVAEVPHPVARDIFAELMQEEPELVSRLAGSDLAIVLGRHKDCVIWAPEAFADACADVPDATTVSCASCYATQDPAFLEAVRGAVTSRR
jgi:hypothetical protein